MQGNIGEAYVQYLLSLFTLVHKIDGSNDVGNDFICELVHDQSPTNLLFYVQVKYTIVEPVIKLATWNYWKSSPIPVYIFWIKKEKGQGRLENLPFEALIDNTRYKPCTPLLHEKKGRTSGEFIQYNRQGFLRDLIDDHSRTAYMKGYATLIKPRDYLNLDEKIAIGLPLRHLSVEMISLIYAKRIIDNGWINLYALAVSLHKVGGRKKDTEALDLLIVALRIMTPTDKKESSRLRKEIEDLRNTIQNSLR